MNSRKLEQLHIVTALVENKAGVLARVASLFARRGFNIHSLAVAPTNDPAQTEGNREARLDAYRRVRDDLRARILREWPLGEPRLPSGWPSVPVDSTS